ncbi:hypothetical protein LSAT2_000814 [Lamellibrachia satsuma]|nr:hypothetical protein LSAT2_000814 [Lamellibrachia satsuma]
MILSNETFGRVLRKMETSVDTSIEGEIYYSSCENNLCKPKRLLNLAVRWIVRNTVVDRLNMVMWIVELNLSVRCIECTTIVDRVNLRVQKPVKMTYFAICLQGKTIMLFAKDQQNNSSNVLRKWKRTLSGAMKCVNNWYPAFTGCSVNVTGLESGSQVTLALTTSGLSLLNNSLLKTNQPPHSVKRWSLSRVWCELHEDNVVKLFARDRDTTDVYTFQTRHPTAIVSAVEAARNSYLQSRLTPSATGQLFSQGDNRLGDMVPNCYDLTFSHRSRSTGCLASGTTVNTQDIYNIDRHPLRRSHDDMCTARYSCNINKLAADVQRLQNPKTIYSQMNTIVLTAAVHCSGVTNSGVIETVSPRATMRSTLKKRFATPVGSLTLSLPSVQNSGDSVNECHLSQDQETQLKETVDSRSHHHTGRSMYRSVSEHNLLQTQCTKIGVLKVIELCLRLYTLEDHGKNWKAVAEKIGLNYDAVMIIQSFQQNHPCRLTAAEIVLRHWQSMYNAYDIDPLKCPLSCTRDTLVGLLQDIGRLDLVDLLR